MKVGLATSTVLHALLIGFGLLSLAAPPPHEVSDVESLPVDIVPIEELTRIQQGDRSAPVAEVAAPVPTQRPEPVENAENAGDNAVDQKAPPAPQPRPEPIQTAALPPPAPEPVRRPEPAPAPEPAPVAKPEPAPKPEPVPAARPEPAPRQQARPEPAPKPEPAPPPEPRQEARPEPKPEPAPQPEPRQEARPEPTPERTPETAATAPEVASLPETAPRPEARPRPQPQQTAMADERARAADRPAPQPARAAASDRPKPAAPAQAADEKKFNADEIAALLNKDKPAGGGARRSQAPAALGGEKPNAGAKLSQGEMDALRNQFAGCWIVPVGARDASDLRASVRFSVDRSGRLSGAPVVQASSGNRQFDESVVRAVQKCDRDGLLLPSGKEEIWAEIVVNFDPSEMF